MTDNTVGAWALTRLDAIRKLTREGYAVVNAEGYQRLRAQAFGEGVPVGGGEPQPTTSTDNEALCLDPHPKLSQRTQHFRHESGARCP